MSERRDYDVVIVGAGFAGMYMLHRVRGLGLTARVFEAGERRGRHVVLEPLSGRALRRREHGVLVPVLRGAPAGVGVDGALRDPARDPAVRQPRRRPVRPAARHAVRHPGAVGDARRRDQPVDDPHRAPHRRRTREVRAQFLVMATGCLSSANIPDFPGRDTFEGDDVPHRPVAARGRRLHRQARRRDRHRLVGHPVDPDHRGAGAAAHRVPAHRELLGARREPAARPGGDARDQGRLRRRSAPRTASSPTAIGSRLPIARGVGARGRSRRAGADLRERAGSRAACRSSAPSSTCSSTRTRTTPRPSSCAQKIREHREGPGGRRPAVAEDGDRLQAPVRRHRLLRDVQPPERRARRRERDADRARSRRTACASATASSTFDCIVFATGFDAMTGALLKHRHPRPRRAARCATRGRRARARTSASARSASRTSSRSPVPAARRCSRT